MDPINQSIGLHVFTSSRFELDRCSGINVELSSKLQANLNPFKIHGRIDLDRSQSVVILDTGTWFIASKVPGYVLCTNIILTLTDNHIQVCRINAYLYCTCVPILCVYRIKYDKIVTNVIVTLTVIPICRINAYLLYLCTCNICCLCIQYRTKYDKIIASLLVYGRLPIFITVYHV